MKQSSIAAAEDVSRHDATERDVSRHTLTIKQAAEVFSALGAARSPRSVQRFCELGSLDAIRVKGEKTERYFIDPVSVERYAEELKHLESISQLGADVSRRDASQRVTTRSVATEVQPAVQAQPSAPDRQTETLRERVGTLEKDNFQLRIDRAAKEQVIGQIIDQQRAFIEQLTTQGREIGRLEMQVRQLEPPKPDLSRHDATGQINVIFPAPLPEQGKQAAGSAPQPEVAALPVPEHPKRSVWRKIFG